MKANEQNQYAKQAKKPKKSASYYLKKILIFFVPAIAVMLFYLLTSRMESLSIPMTVLHIFTLIWIILLVVTQWLKNHVVTASMLLSALYPFFYDLLREADGIHFKWEYTYFTILTYTLPWAILALLINVVAFRKRKKAEEKKTYKRPF